MDANELKKRMEPPTGDDLDETERIKEEIEKRNKQLEPETAQADDPKSQEEYTFDFSHVDGRGKAWTGKFTTKILNERERRNVGIMRSMLSGNVPYESLDIPTRDSALIHAHLSHCLIKKPKWAEKLDTLLDPRVAQALYEEVMAHEAHFLGLPNNQNPSEETD